MREKERIPHKAVKMFMKRGTKTNTLPSFCTHANRATMAAPITPAAPMLENWVGAALPELEEAALEPAEVPELPADAAREVLAPLAPAEVAVVALVVEPAGVVALAVAPPVLVAAVVEAAPPEVDSVAPDVEEPPAAELVQSVEPPV